MENRATPDHAADHAAKRSSGRILNRTRILMLSVCLLALGACMVYAWMTQDVLVQLNFLRQHNANLGKPGARKSIVGIEPWQTANTLLSMARSSEEQEFAHLAERLADHEVDQAFAAALRLASLRASHVQLTGESQNAAQKVAELEQIVKQDKQQVRQLGGAVATSEAIKKNKDVSDDDNDELQLAQAQLNLDAGELDDARKELAYRLGDNSDQIQQDLNAYHVAQQQAEATRQAAQQTAVPASQRRTLKMRISSLRRQNERTRMLQQAAAQAGAEAATLVNERAAVQKKLSDALAATPAGLTQLAQLKDRNSARLILSAYDSRIEDDRQLVSVYNKWIAQVAVQRSILIHLLVVSLTWIFVTLLGAIVLGMLAQQLLERLHLDNRQTHTLRTLTRMGLQLGSVVIVLLIVFGAPQQASTVLGLTTAALTIALQDFVLAFFGWFLLMGRNGIHVGDWVEINGVHGEVEEVGLFNTSLLELSNLPGKGRPTGRRISFLNSYAIRGQYFNFSTSSQWMWDSVSVGIPKTLDVHKVAAEIEQLVQEKTAEDARAAEHDWKRVARGSSMINSSTSSAISMRPTVEGIEATVFYITRATDRIAARDRLYLQLLALLQTRQAVPAEAAEQGKVKA